MEEIFDMLAEAVNDKETKENGGVLAAKMDSARYPSPSTDISNKKGQIQRNTVHPCP